MPFLLAIAAWFTTESLPTFAADGGALIRLTYTEVADRILPFPQVTSTAVNLEIRLQTGGNVQQDEARASGRARGGGKQALRLGKGQQHAWHVAGPNQLVNVRDYYSYKRAIQVTVSGSSCTARIGYNLKPGYRDYQYPRLTNGERATARSVSAGNVTCSIQ